MAIRRSSGGARSLDDALRALWRRSFDEGRGYDLEDVLACIDTAAGRSLSRFVLALVEGPFDPNLGEALELFGLELEGRGAPVPFLGVRFRSDTTILASVEDGTPAHAAGLCPGDELLAVDGLRVESDSWNTVWDQVAAADRPVSILLAFIVMKWQGLGANIMSVGGIAISIGVLVDAAIIMVENAHKHYEHWKGKRSHFEIILRSTQEVGPTLFFTLVVITVSFLPVFTLQAQEGRLFRPLALTKTYSLGMASLLAVPPAVFPHGVLPLAFDRQLVVAVTTRLSSDRQSHGSNQQSSCNQRSSRRGTLSNPERAGHRRSQIDC